VNFNDLKGSEWYYNNVKILVEDTRSIIIDQIYIDDVLIVE